MDGPLTFKLAAREAHHSGYDWMNIDLGDVRVGKVRGFIDGNSLTICSINIFPEFERRGFARAAIVMFKEKFHTIIADRVRYTAFGFWDKMGFSDQGDGIWIFEARNRG